MLARTGPLTGGKSLRSKSREHSTVDFKPRRNKFMLSELSRKSKAAAQHSGWRRGALGICGLFAGGGGGCCSFFLPAPTLRLPLFFGPHGVKDQDPLCVMCKY